MQHQNTLALTQSALTVIDMQEAFRTKIPDFAEVTARIATMVTAAKLLNLPIIVTEQYPKGLGHTAQEILDALPDSIEIIEKTTFSSCGVTPFRSQLNELGAKQILVCGIEAHICVNQTVHDLLANQNHRPADQAREALPQPGVPRFVVRGDGDACRLRRRWQLQR